MLQRQDRSQILGIDVAVSWYNMGSWLAGLSALALLAVSSAQHIPLTFPYGVASGTILVTQTLSIMAPHSLLPCQASTQVAI